MGAAGAAVVPVAGAIAERWRGLVAQGQGRLDIAAARLGLDAGTGPQESPVGHPATANSSADRARAQTREVK
jgi:hypothetical protein